MDESHLNNIKNVTILVVGDLMLDTFIYGDVDRISPEGPIPVLSIKRQAMMLGGAGNVVSNLAALGANAVIFAAIGDDDEGEKVRAIIKSTGADDGGLVVDETRPTTLKTRYVAQGQQLLRSDFEKTHPLDSRLENETFKNIEAALKPAKALVISDYGKGFLKGGLVQKIIAAAGKAGVPVLVDPKGADFSIYRGADIVTPNRKELAAATGTDAIKTDEDIIAAANIVIKDCGIKNVIATRSEDGMSLVRSSAPPVHMVADLREVFDVSGAGDTVIATIAAAIAGGADIESAARLANIAAGIAVSKTGTTPVTYDELRASLPGQKRTSNLADWATAQNQIRHWREQGLIVGMTGGCFDILHYGHVNYLNDTRAQCDRLVVAINHDASVKILKGPTRPVNDEVARATVIGALGSVDMVVMFGATKAGADNTPCALLDELRPDIFFKGGDYTIESLPETKIVHGYGGKVSIMPIYEGYSTTDIIGKSQKSG